MRITLGIAFGVLLGTLSGISLPPYLDATNNETWDLAVFTQPLLDYPLLYSFFLSSVIGLFFLAPIASQQSFWVIWAVAILSSLIFANGYVVAGFLVFQESLQNWLLSFRELHWQRLLLLHPAVCGTLCAIGLGLVRKPS